MRGGNALPQVGDKYRLLEQIGSGGMSVVYRAEHLLIGREVAVKLLLPERAGDRALGARLMREARALGKLHHPGVAQVMDAGVCEMGPYLVMEFLEGVTLNQFIRQTKLTIDAALGVVVRVLDALSAAHDVGIVHRDLKPENVFLSLDDANKPSIKLLDFGIAKSLEEGGDSEARTSTGMILGTPDYLSPEQATGDHWVDARSDVFSAGVMLYELLTGDRPFAAASAVATAYRIAHSEPEPLSQRKVPRGPALDALLGRAMAKDRERRYTSAQDFRRDLIALIEDPDAMELELAGSLRLRQSQRVAARSRQSPVPQTPTVRLDQEVPRHRAVRTSRPPIAAAPKPSSPSELLVAERELRASRPVRERVDETLESPRQLDWSHRPKAEAQSPFHTRGAVIQALDRYVGQNFAPWMHRRVLDGLPPDARTELEEQTLQAIVYYPMDMATSYLRVATDELYGGNPAWCRQAGESAVEGSLGPMLRSALRLAPQVVVLRRLTTACKPLLDFGDWQLDPHNGELTIENFEAAPMGLRLWLTGVLSGGLRHACPGARLEVRRGEQSFARRLVLTAQQQSPDD
ncbi:MAG: serine/threonine-protein kinase [Polyangiaceae bacterium]